MLIYPEPKSVESESTGSVDSTHRAIFHKRFYVRISGIHLASRFVFSWLQANGCKPAFPFNNKFGGQRINYRKLGPYVWLYHNPSQRVQQTNKLNLGNLGHQRTSIQYIIYNTISDTVYRIQNTVSVTKVGPYVCFYQSPSQRVHQANNLTWNRGNLEHQRTSIGL